MTLLRQWRKTLAAGQPVYPFRDMLMAPTPVGVAAAAITALLTEQCSGIWQLSGPEDVSYAEIAAHIARRLDSDRSLVRPVAAASAGMPEGSTPRHTTLDSSAMRGRFGIAAPATFCGDGSSISPLPTTASDGEESMTGRSWHRGSTGSRHGFEAALAGSRAGGRGTISSRSDGLSN